MSKKTEVSDRIKELRVGLGFSQEELAAQSGVSRRAVQDIERGLNSPSVTTLEALAGALGVPIIEFFRKADGKLSIPGGIVKARGIQAGLKQETKLVRVEAEKQMLKASKSAKVIESNFSSVLSPLCSMAPTVDDVAAMVSRFAKVSPSRRSVALAILFDDASLAPEVEAFLDQYDLEHPKEA